MAPLYDMLSAQPSLDAHQISRNRMRLAMAVGDKRHYRVDEVLPRHFIQTAARTGVGQAVVDRLLAELADEAPRAIERTFAALPTGFPEGIAAS